MTFDCKTCKYDFHKTGFVCGKGILYIKKICNKEIACVAFQRGDIPKKKSRDEMINNIVELVG